MKFAIWHQDESLTSTPEFSGSENEVVSHWLSRYDSRIRGLYYKIASADPTRRWEQWIIAEGSLQNNTPPEG